MNASLRATEGSVAIAAGLALDYEIATDGFAVLAMTG